MPYLLYRPETSSPELVLAETITLALQVDVMITKLSPRETDDEAFADVLTI
ncbi:MAG: hypothetical protein HC888_00470 [Candidatus Competibacteraceae bacterium]|nr:hypothetical protein [Candidatus Competibacteraceae bacterium]